jgi:hypothetical protein
MKQTRFGARALVALIGLAAAAGAAHAAGAPTGEWMARVQSVAPGGRQFEVTDGSGARVRVMRPVRPPQATGDIVNAGALHEGDTVLLSGVGYGRWFEAQRVEVLTEERVGGATAPEPVLRFTGFDGGRELRAVDADGTEYRIVFPPRPQMIAVWKGGGLAEMSALREGDRFIARGRQMDHTIRADRVEVLDESRLGGGAAVPLVLTYRGSPGWRTLIGEAADGAQYVVSLPRRPQALYYVRNGAQVETSALRPGDSMEVRGLVRGDRIEAREIILR